MNDKQRVAQEAALRVENGMVVGLGTGSTANCFIEALAGRCKEENLRITTVASSVVSTLKAQEFGLPMVAMEHLTHLDIYVDGADEVAPDLTLLKGQGADLVKEKILARASDQFLVLVDQSKMVQHIGERFAIPIEVIPFAWRLVKKALAEVGGRGELRKIPGSDGLMVTSHGSLVLDMVFDANMDCQRLSGILNDTSGIVEHGIFYGLASSVMIGSEGQVQLLHY